ncbi:MAG TPA: tripartite tricarboxylate transporter substrate-binding protein, partial [Burkholderiales bacterium]|nr:tripartite tricarboxylate transporter substrate-binding protein [Burkholderiales bacterium]
MRAAACFILALCCASASAQQYPSKVVRLVTGSAPAGGADLTARALQQKLVPALGGQVIIDNRPGVAGMIANEYTGKAPADGYTLLLQPGSFVTVSTHLNARPPWDPLKHLAPIIQVSYYDFVLVAHPSVPATNAKQLIGFARKKPGSISFASSGVGSNFHLAG